LAIYSQNQHDYLAAVLGTLMAGGQVALCNPSYRPEELSRNLAMVGARAILASVASLERAQEAVEMNRREREEEIGLFVFEEGHERSWEGLLLRKGERRAGDGARALERVVIHPLEDTAIVCFSSGTSGPPKAVELTHSNLVANVIQATFLLLDRMNEPLFDEGDWYAAGGSKKVVDAGSKLSSEFHIDVLPCFHCYGLLVSMVAIHTCTPRVVLPRFELELFLKSVQDHRITFCFVVPPILLALARSPLVEGYDISSLTRVASGAASLPSELCQEVRKRLGILSTDGY
ncbi:acetyl-CoA synthetase-like protein, partial [Violaceomyces palustris]